ncbi:C-type lectin BpLec-like [Chelonia mydas]|uniref:C-type lectin BpLec-like n=1 Tax=Chelonia mydas TaxID=8469 RepID=UPI001CA8B790|nr:C-type lectin BpLec-like [Chelonia mydas]
MGPVAYFSLCLLGCLIFSPSLAGARDVTCPEGWLPFQGNCYGYFFQEKTWIEAEVECRHHGNGAHLVSIHSTGENNVLALYVKRYHRKNSPVWIGLLDLEQNQSWRWADKSLVSFNAWDNGQPDNQNLNEACVVLESPGFQKWHDYPCEHRHSFICKRKP